MKELDFTEAKTLRWLLIVGGDYAYYELEDVKEICTLTRMVFMSILKGAVKILGIALILLLVIWGLVSMASVFTLYLPEKYYAPLQMIIVGYFGILLTLTLISYFGVMLWREGRIKFAPDYITKYLPKSKNSEKVQVEQKPSKTWLAVKEMCKSFKDKTCIKVKL